MLASVFVRRQNGSKCRFAGPRFCRDSGHIIFCQPSSSWLYCPAARTVKTRKMISLFFLYQFQFYQRAAPMYVCLTKQGALQQLVYCNSGVGTTIVICQRVSQVQTLSTMLESSFIFFFLQKSWT